MNLRRKQDVLLRELMRDLLDNFADWRCGAAKVQALHFIQGGAPWRRDESDNASILREAVLRKESYIVAMDKFDP